ncbi:MAG TPA: TPM domain-containing protein [Candidatus Eisenbacteria bacterium]|nr:TPM domain-containing protein [Candidatus Eisenbacteria bacterium]
MTSSSRIFAPTRAGAAFAALLLLALLAAPAARAADRPFPEPRGFLSDFAGIVDAASADSITSLGRELEEKAGAEIAVVTLPDLGGETIDPVATALFAQWGIGKKGKDDGVLVLLALEERKVKIETGYGVEGILPDGKCGAIIRRVMGPDLSAGRYGVGLLAGARSIAGAIAADRGVTIAGSTLPPEGGARGAEAPAWVLLLIFLVILVVFTRIAGMAARMGGMGPYRDWRTRRRGGNDPFGGFGGGWGGMGGFGGGGFGGGGGGGGGGGFGGFGGGRSGGGGASGGF